MNRADCLREIAVAVTAAVQGRPLRVAVDGIDASGKTTLADELAVVLAASENAVVRASVDGFHQSQIVRRQRGTLSSEGYFYNAFDYKTLKHDLLEPLSDGGSRVYRTQAFDFRTDQPVTGGWQTAPENTVLIVDGVFLQRAELNLFWDLRIWIDIPLELALQRALMRDLELFGSAEVVRERYTQRYLPAQNLYIAQCQPKANAQLIVENSNPLQPTLYRTGL